MIDLNPTIRNAARAVILRDDQILLLRKLGGSRGERYALPGGAQETGESLESALQRECVEEIGTTVQIVDLVYLADYFKQRDTVPPSIRQLVEFMFLCKVPEDYQARSGSRPDKHQVGVVWASLERLAELPLYPTALAGFLTRLHGNPGKPGEPGEQNPPSVYLGTID